MADADDKKQHGLVPAEASLATATELLKHYVLDMEGVRVVDLSAVLTTVQDMTPVAAQAIEKVAEQTHAVPAREQTKRSWLATARHFGTLALVGLALVYVLPKLTEPWMIGGLVLLVVIIFGILRIIKAVKGGDD